MLNNLQFRKPENGAEWDQLVLTLPNYSFLNSCARYEYLEGIGSNSFRYLICVDDKFKGIVAGNIGYSRIFGKFLECKHSPMVNEESEALWQEVITFCKRLAADNGCFMVRMSPLYTNNKILEDIYQKNRAVKAPTHNIDALISQYFDMKKGEEELRHDMTDSTRNNINKLTKNPDISVKVFNDDSQFEIFRDFHEQTRKKKGYADKPADMLLEELRVQVNHNMCYMIVGYFKNKPISIWQCTVFGKYMHVYQAGSDTEFREKNIRITYLLFWESVKLAKELNCEILDLFGGMVPVNYRGKNHPWVGVDSFKESLGGKKITYMHTRDIPINQFKYSCYYMYSWVRTTLKGYTIRW